MYFTLDVIIPEKDRHKLNISEELVTWGEETFSREPPEYMYEGKLRFRKYVEMTYYESFTRNNLDLRLCMALSLEGMHLLELEHLINAQKKDITNHVLIQFLFELFQLDTFAILMIRDEEYIDKTYYIHTKEELIKRIDRCLNWSTPEGVLLIRK